MIPSFSGDPLAPHIMTWFCLGLPLVLVMQTGARLLWAATRSSSLSLACRPHPIPSSQCSTRIDPSLRIVFPQMWVAGSSEPHAQYFGAGMRQQTSAGQFPQELARSCGWYRLRAPDMRSYHPYQCPSRRTVSLLSLVGSPVGRLFATGTLVGPGRSTQDRACSLSCRVLGPWERPVGLDWCCLIVLWCVVVLILDRRYRISSLRRMACHLAPRLAPVYPGLPGLPRPRQWGSLASLLRPPQVELALDLWFTTNKLWFTRCVLWFF